VSLQTLRLGPGGMPSSSGSTGVIASTAEGELTPATSNHALAKCDLSIAKTTGPVDGGSTEVFRASDTTALTAAMTSSLPSRAPLHSCPNDCCLNYERVLRYPK